MRFPDKGIIRILTGCGFRSQPGGGIPESGHYLSLLLLIKGCVFPRAAPMPGVVPAGNGSQCRNPEDTSPEPHNAVISSGQKIYAGGLVPEAVRF